MSYNVTGRIKIVEVDEVPRAAKFGNVSTVSTRTNLVLSTETGLLFSNIVDDIEISNEAIYVLSNERLSVLNSSTFELEAFLSKPSQSVQFTSIAVGRALLYLGANDGVYSIPKSRLDGNSDSFLTLKFNSDDLGGRSVGDVFWKELQGTDYLLISHDQGLTIVSNDNNTNRKLLAPDSNPGKVHLSSRGQVYYQNSTSGFYFLDKIPSESAPFNVFTPAPDFIFNTISSPSIPSTDFRGFDISEDTVSGVRNTLFIATASGVSVMTEDLNRPNLNDIKNISIGDVSDIRVSPGATKDTGQIFFVTNDPNNGGTFATYDLVLDQTINTVSSSSDELIDNDDFTIVREY